MRGRWHRCTETLPCTFVGLSADRQASKIFYHEGHEEPRRCTETETNHGASRGVLFFFYAEITGQENNVTVDCVPFLRAPSWFFVSFVVKIGAEAHPVLADEILSQPALNLTLRLRFP
jgi:hypothetical protein